MHIQVNYRLRLDVQEIDNSKTWVLEESRMDGAWRIIERGTHKEMVDSFHRHKEDQKEEN